MTTHVTGVFDVKIIRQPAEAIAAGDGIGRMLLDKRFHGDLDATSVGQMLAMRTAVEGSAGYVAMELVIGRLHGKSGTFVLQHSGTMNRGQATLDLHVVPDSGTQELHGLSGKMAIDIRDGQHFYTFDYDISAGS
jgi:Protein of unknown function (DUF3224)